MRYPILICKQLVIDENVCCKYFNSEWFIKITRAKTTKKLASKLETTAVPPSAPRRSVSRPFFINKSDTDGYVK